MTSQSVKNATFTRSMRGYNVEEVDNFLEKVIVQLEEDAKEAAALKQKIVEQEKQMAVQSQTIVQYHKDEDNLKSALLNAQRMGESVIHEAKQKADAILREANIRAENITQASEAKVVETEQELERVQSEVSAFKATILNLYKQHIESLSTLPEKEPEPVAEEEPVAVEQPEQEEAAAPAVEEVPVTEPAAEEGIWDRDEKTLTQPEPEQATKSGLDAFHNIRFSD